MAPNDWAASAARSQAATVPEITMFPGHNRLAICSTSPPRVFSQRASTWTGSSPSTLTIPLGVASAASCMAAPRCCTSISPSSKSITPAKTIAVYSPKLRPAAASHASTTSGDSARRDSSAARLVTNSAGWLTTVESSSSAGPSKQIFARS